MSKKPIEKAAPAINPLELYIGNIPSAAALDDLKKFYPDAVDFTMPKKHVGDKKYAFVSFPTAQDARAAFDKSKSFKIAGALVTVGFSKVKPESAKSPKKTEAKTPSKEAPQTNGTKKQTPAKAAVSQPSKKNEESSDDEEEDDDDDEEDMEGEEGVVVGADDDDDDEELEDEEDDDDEDDSED